MSKERPFEDIVPVPNIKVGYFEKRDYLEIIDRQGKQIEAFGYQIMALQSKIETLEKSQRSQGKWVKNFDSEYPNVWHYECSECHERPLCSQFTKEDFLSGFCPHCGARMVEK